MQQRLLLFAMAFLSGYSLDLMNTPMDEVQRQAYLQGCGITLWYSRAPLPGAAPSIEFDFPQATAEVQVAVGGGHAGPAEPVLKKSAEERPKVAAQKAILSKVVAEAAKPERAPQVPTENSLTQAHALSGLPVQPVAENLLAVNLRYALTADLVLIAQLGDDLPADLQEKLLLQIARALGRPVSPEALGALTWPAFANRAVPGNDDRGLAGVLERVLGQCWDRTWLGLGAEISGVLRGLCEGAPGREGVLPPQIFFEHDLAELAASGALKRQLWNLMCSSPERVLRVGH